MSLRARPPRRIKRKVFASVVILSPPDLVGRWFAVLTKLLCSSFHPGPLRFCYAISLQARNPGILQRFKRKTNKQDRKRQTGWKRMKNYWEWRETQGL